MRIVIKTLSDQELVFYVNPSDSIFGLKRKIDERIGMPIKKQLLILSNRPLDNDRTLQYYNIKNDEKLTLVSEMSGGSFAAYEPSKVVGYLEEDDKAVIGPLPHGKLQSRYIRNTNASGVYEQIARNCYAYAACSAYINTIMRIYGSRPPPSFYECFQIANYNGNNGGDTYKAIQLLENHFNYGILCDRTNKISVRDAITLSCIASFSTSENGWKYVAKGNLLEYPGGIKDNRHAALIDGYDFDKKCFICKNSWGGVTAEPRFNFNEEACHDFYFVRVFFTLNSIKSKTSKKFVQNLVTFKGKYNGYAIDAAWMDYKTALYSSEYVCEYCPDTIGEYKYKGYNVDQWIMINLKD